MSDTLDDNFLRAIRDNPKQTFKVRTMAAKVLEYRDRERSRQRMIDGAIDNMKVRGR